MAEVVHGIDQGPCCVGAGFAVGVAAVGVQLLDLLDQGGGGIGNILGRLNKVTLGSWVVGLGRGEAAGVAEGRGVLGNHCGRGEDLLLAAGGVAQLLAGSFDGLRIKQIPMLAKWKLADKTIKKQNLLAY